MRRILAVALMVAGSPAMAGSLVSSPITAIDTGLVVCSIQYIGPSATAIPVLITIKEKGTILLRDNRARLSVSNPGYTNQANCDPLRGTTCENVVCAFSFTGDKSLFRASACAGRGLFGESGGQVCLPAY